MGKYVRQRLLMAIPILLGVLTTVFLLVHLVPGDPAEAILGEYATKDSLAQLRQQMGLNAPLYQQYAHFIGGAVLGDFGRSIQTKQPVVQRILEAFPYSLELAIAAILVAVLIGLPLGVIAATRRNSGADYVAMVASLLGVSMPSFWTGILLLILFAVNLHWLPITGAGRGGFLADLKYLILPALTLGAGEAGLIARMTRSALLEVLALDYVRTAKAKGLHERRVIYRHALKNALIPVVTVVGLNMGRLLGGTVIMEALFVRPGLGRVLMSAMQARDYPQIQGTIAFFAVLILVVNLMVDLTYGLLDPRIRYD
ncbi:MAG: ABC transporter permease [Mycobacterium leprae]